MCCTEMRGTLGQRLQGPSTFLRTDAALMLLLVEVSACGAGALSCRRPFCRCTLISRTGSTLLLSTSTGLCSSTAGASLAACSADCASGMQGRLLMLHDPLFA